MGRVISFRFVFVLSLLTLVCGDHSSAQSPDFINYQPFKLDFSPAQRANDQMFQMQAEMAREEGRRREEAMQNKIEQVKVYYASAPSYPSSLSDGWYDVWATNNTTSCEMGKARVVGNKVTEYYLDDIWEVSVSLATPITAGKCMLQLGDKGNFFDLYFLDVIADPTKQASPPLEPGTVSFWGEYRKPTKVFLEKQYMGTITEYYNEAPSCLGTGTLDFDLRPGEYSISAEAGSRRWTTTVVVRANKCSVVNVSTR